MKKSLFSVVYKYIFEICLFVLTCIWSVPLFITIINGLKDETEIKVNINGFPKNPIFKNWIDAFHQGNFGVSFLTSILLAAVSMVLIIIICSSVSYPIARIKNKFNSALYMVFLTGIMVPGGLTMVPNYKLFVSLHINNTPFALLALYIATNTPFMVLLYTGFLKTIPRGLDESAKIDGCTPVYTYWKIIFPLLKPVTATAIIMVSVPIYNDFFNPLLYASSLKTVTLSLYNFSGKYYTAWNMIFAGVTITMVPPLLVYIIFQSQFEKGLVSGSVKG